MLLRPQFIIPVSLVREDVVIKVLDQVAHRFKMLDAKVMSNVPETLANYSAFLGSGCALSARRHSDTVIVDFNPGSGEGSGFEVMNAFVADFRAVCGIDLVPVSDEYYVPIPSIPITKEHSDQTAQFFEQHRKSRCNDDGML